MTQPTEIPGLLLSNLGSPDAPTTSAVRRYLRQFLGDPRVVELPRWQWALILNLFVLPFRPRRSAEAYRKIWGDDGSPLIVGTTRLAAALEEKLRSEGKDVRVRAGMSYGSPSIATALEELRELGCGPILHLPLYPQNSGTTTGAAWDALARALGRWRRIPTLAQIDDYATHPAHIEALAASLRAAWDETPAGDHLLFSFHGIPERYERNGDVYPSRCRATARAVAERLGLPEGRWSLAYQSRFGKEPWVGPATDEVLEKLGLEGCSSVDVLCPAFAVDCLETLEEVDIGYRELFEANGGRFRYIPALNDSPGQVNSLAEIVRPQLSLWLRGEAIRK